MRHDLLTPERRAMITPYVRFRHLIFVITHPREAWYEWRTQRAYAEDHKRLGITPPRSAGSARISARG